MDLRVLSGSFGLFDPILVAFSAYPAPSLAVIGLVLRPYCDFIEEIRDMITTVCPSYKLVLRVFPCLKHVGL